MPSMAIIDVLKTSLSQEPSLFSGGRLAIHGDRHMNIGAVRSACGSYCLISPKLRGHR